MSDTTTTDTTTTDGRAGAGAGAGGLAGPYRWRWVALFVILAAEVMDLLHSPSAAPHSPVMVGARSIPQPEATGY